MFSSGEYKGQRRLRFAAASIGAFAALVWAAPSFGATATPLLPPVSTSLGGSALPALDTTLTSAVAPVVAEVVAAVPTDTAGADAAPPTDPLTTAVTNTVASTGTVVETAVETVDSTVTPIVTTAKTVVDTTVAAVDSTLVAPVIMTAPTVVRKTVDTVETTLVAPVVTTAETVVGTAAGTLGTPRAAPTDTATPRTPAGPSTEQNRSTPSGAQVEPAAADVASTTFVAAPQEPIDSVALPAPAEAPAVVPAERAALPGASLRSALLSKPFVTTTRLGEWSPGTLLPPVGGGRDAIHAADAARPGNLAPTNAFGSGVPRSATPTFGAAGTGAGGAALILLACLSLFLWAAPPLRRWLRRQHGSWLLPVPVAPLERPG
jgi:hypothetical protein